MEFAILGPLLVLDGTSALKITTKQRALVARLLIDANHTVSVERLIEDLFAGDRLASPEAALHNQVSRLRKALGAAGRNPVDVVVRKGAGFCLEIEPGDLDAWRFETLAGAGRGHLNDGEPARAADLLGQALSLWRGAALADVALADFALAEAARLEELRLCAREDHAAAGLALGAAREVVAELEALVAEHPLRERLWSLLMVALARCGRQAEALRTYQRLCALFGQELGLRPSPEVRDLELAILRQEPGLAVALGRYPGGAAWTAERRAAHNLPALVSRFVGRGTQRAELTEQLVTDRLVTLTGIGGVGKTRLALEVAAGMLPPPAGGVWLVDVSGLADATGVLPCVAAALSVREQPGVALLDSVVAAVRTSEMLVVVDNCEHLSAPVGDLVATLLASCPNLRVLATSREVLGVAGEVVYPVPPLSAPPGDHAATPEAIAAAESVQLFVDRAVRVRPDFVLGPDNAAEVASICRRLDGLPLALELAAARLETLRLDEVAQVLGARFGLLAGGDRMVPVGHANLLDTLEWSHDLLAEPERLLLRRLSWFEGGAALDAVEVVCAGQGLDPHAVHGLLARLVATTLVVTTTTGARIRYRLLDTVRAYARDRLVASGEAPAMARAHAEWCVGLAERAEPRLEGPDQLAWLARLDAEHDNLRAALAWAVADGEAELGVRLAGALTLFWDLRGCFSEGRGWLERALEAGRPPQLVRAKALLGIGVLSCMLEDHDKAVPSIDQAGAIFAEHGDGRGVARSRLWLGACLLTKIDDGPVRARRLFDLSEAAAGQVGDEWCSSLALSMAGWSEMHGGSANSAGPLFEQALGVARRTADRLGLEISLTGAGEVAMAQGDHPMAERTLCAALDVARELGHEYVEGTTLCRLGELAADAGDFARAEALLHEARSILRRAGTPGGVSDCLCALGRVEQARNDLDAAVACFEEARTMAEQKGKLNGEALLGLGAVCGARGETERARDYFAAALSVAQAKGNRSGMSWALHELGNLALRGCDGLDALSLHRDALAHRAAVGDLPGVGRSLGVLGALAMLHGKPREAARLGGAAKNLRGPLGFAAGWSEHWLIEPTLQKVRNHLPPTEFAAAWAEGSALSATEAVEYARAVVEAMSDGSK